MKHKWLQGRTVLMLACLLSPLTAYSTDLIPYTGSANKQFKLQDLKGQTHSLTDYKGKVILVNFWASWCKSCVHELPELTQLKKQLSDLPFEVLAINTSEGKIKVSQFTKRINFNLPVLLDTSSKLLYQWKVKLLPTSFLIDDKGLVRYQVRGNPGWDNERTISIIKGLINEAAIAD